ncbi:hypothetical protein LNQ52_31860 [Klebsiella pneumoniae subsp. pneumoniae]|nr:hypothetical protein [Klebsiella pneumoniae subsp. pneumoniae]
MQLRKLATAMLVMGMTAGLAQAEDAAPAAGQNTLDKIAKNGVIVVSAIVNLRSRSLTTITSRRLWATLRIIPTPSSMPSRKTEQTRSAGQTDPGHLAEPYPVAAEWHL